MAEKITIFELDIDIDASKRDIEDLRLAVNELKKGLKELSDAEKENNKQLDEQRKKLKELQNAKKQDVKAIAETQSNIDKLLVKRTELNKSIIDQTTVLKTNQSQLNQNQKVIQNSIAVSEGWNQQLEEEKIRQQQLTAERKKVIREGIKLANEAKELTRLQNKQNLSEQERIRLNALLVKRRKSLIVTTKEERKEYNKLTVAIAKNNKILLRNDKSIGRFQRNVGNYTNALRGFAGALGLTGGLVAVTQFIKGSTDAYREQTLVVSKLTTVVKERTNATDADIRSILALTNAQQRLGIIGDEVQIAGAQQIATFVNSTESIKTLIPALNNLLAQQKGVNATTQDAVNIGNLFGKTLNGEVSSLKRVGISFTDAQKEILKFGTETEKSAVLAEVITQNVGEMNEELAQTDIGELKNLENQLGDIEEKIGEQVLPALLEWKQFQLDILQGIQNLSKGYDVLAFEQAKINVQGFVDAQKFSDEITKQNEVRKRFLEIEKEIVEFEKFFRENKERILDFDDKEIRLAKEKASALVKEKKLLIELGQQGFFNTQFKEKELEETNKIVKTEQQLEKERKAAEKAARERERKRREEQREDERIQRESEKVTKEIQDAIIKELEISLERKKLLNQEEFNDYNELLLKKFEFGIITEEEYQNEVIRLNIETQEKINELNAQNAENEKQRRITDQENELALLETNILGELEAERRKLELKEQQEIEFAERIGANTTLIEKKYSDAKKELARAESEAKLSLASDFFANVAQIAGEGTAIAKAAAVAETTINTYKSATAAYSALAGIPIVGPVLGAVAAGAAVAAGIANVKKILSVKSGLPGEGGGSGASTPSASSASPTNQRPQAVAPEIGRGIISRDAPISTQRRPATQTAVIVDDVTAKQSQKESNSTTSVI
jgi:hypothetical protein